MQKEKRTAIILRPDNPESELMERLIKPEMSFRKYTLSLNKLVLSDGDLTSQIDLSWMTEELGESEIALVLSAKLHLRKLFDLGFSYVVIDPNSRQSGNRLEEEQIKPENVIGEGLHQLEIARCYTFSEENIFKRTLELADMGVIPIQTRDEKISGYLTKSFRRLIHKKPFIVIKINESNADIFCFGND